MGASAIPIIVFTLLWGIVGIVLPFVVPKGPNRGIFQLVLMLTAATCWLLFNPLKFDTRKGILLLTMIEERHAIRGWLCCYMAQMNPLIGPKLSNHTLLLMAREWGNPLDI